jgi:hypothetical protein
MGSLKTAPEMRGFRPPVSSGARVQMKMAEGAYSARVP